MIFTIKHMKQLKNISETNMTQKLSCDNQSCKWHKNVDAGNCMIYFDNGIETCYVRLLKENKVMKKIRLGIIVRADSCVEIKGIVGTRHHRVLSG